MTCPTNGPTDQLGIAWTAGARLRDSDRSRSRLRLAHFDDAPSSTVRSAHRRPAGIASDHCALARSSWREDRMYDKRNPNNQRIRYEDPAGASTKIRALLVGAADSR